jgi:signal peptidase I
MSWRFWTEGLGSFVLAIFLALLVRWTLVEAYMIPTSSMLPSLMANDHIFVNKLIYGLRKPFSQDWIVHWKEPQRGEVIVFRRSEGGDNPFFIKRVIGVPGDRVYIENNHVYVNEKLVERRVPTPEEQQAFPNPDKEAFSLWMETLDDHTYGVLYGKDDTPSSPLGPLQVPYGSYFVLGDHRDLSDDSRTWLPTRFVSRDAVIGRASMVWLSCDETLPALPFLCDPRSVRWTRLFHFIR